MAPRETNFPENTKSSYISSEIIGILFLKAISAIFLKWLTSKTDPQGLDGLLMTKAAVLWSIWDFRWTKSISHFLSGSRL